MSLHSEQYILDKEGRKYRLCIILDHNTLLVVRLEYQGVYVGEAKCFLQSQDEMVLKDIIIDNKVTHRYRNLLLALWQKAVPAKPINYRRRGLGSSLLEFIINYARSKGIKHISGKVVKQDIDNNPSLLKWYENHGFRVIKAVSQANSSTDTVAKIYLDIN